MSFSVQRIELVTHPVPFRAKVDHIVFIGVQLHRNAGGDVNTVAGEVVDLVRVVGNQSNRVYLQILEI